MSDPSPGCLELVSYRYLYYTEHVGVLSERRHVSCKFIGKVLFKQKIFLQRNVKVLAETEIVVLSQSNCN